MNKLWILLISFQFFYVVNGQNPNHIGCKNEQGDPVDWFIVYKLPRQFWSNDTQIKHGFAYLYMDASTYGQWKRSDPNISIQNKTHSVGYTLDQFYANKNNASVFTMLYNDEWPDGNYTLTMGHTKGSLVFDSFSGFWLIHSVPKFPPEESYVYPLSGGKYGQAFFCLTFPYSMLNEIAHNLYLNEPWIYYSFLPTEMAMANVILAKVVQNQTQESAPFFRQSIVKTLGGTELSSFAKSGKWGEELYTDLIAPEFRSTLFVESWQNGNTSNNIGSNCTAQFHVYNIANVTLNSDFDSTSFSIHYDHSKWTVTNNTADGGGANWICIGDTNRQKGQFIRGGGTMCMQDAHVWKTFYGSITRIELCRTD